MKLSSPSKLGSTAPAPKEASHSNGFASKIPSPSASMPKTTNGTHAVFTISVTFLSNCKSAIESNDTNTSKKESTPAKSPVEGDSAISSLAEESPVEETD